MLGQYMVNWHCMLRLEDRSLRDQFFMVVMVVVVMVAHTLASLT